LPVVIARPMNTIGPRQYPEKAVPLFTINALLGEPMPLYGDGLQERDRFYVDDHAAALDVLLYEGEAGEVYNAGAGNYAQNRLVAETICDLLDRPHDLIRPVADRPGHDRQYRLDTAKLRVLGWQPAVGLQEALRRTVDWYRAHPEWWQPLRERMQQGYYQRQYGERLGSGEWGSGSTARAGCGTPRTVIACPRQPKAARSRPPTHYRPRASRSPLRTPVRWLSSR
jgi:dTDP-glucose 4,6-dehydratase